MTSLLILALLQDVGPLLESRCAACHHPGKAKGGLDLSTREGLLRGGTSGPAVVPGAARDSLLWRSAARLEKPYMPHKEEALPAKDVAALAAWIDAGVPYARPLKAGPGKEEGRWAFGPLRPGEGGIDDLLRARLAARGMSLSPEADRRTLIRRATFDLHGLPPTPEEVEAFVRDGDAGALIDRLLASPRYGERWARHWLDVARYADSDGYRFDYDRKHAWPYRDFVIRALNEDLPFDVFVRWQIAGDEIAPDDPRALAATGFCVAGPLQEKTATDSKRNQERIRYDELDDVVSTIGSAFLGLTVGCARCHDHKFDPIPTKEYYRLVAAFSGTGRRELALVPRPEREEQRRRETAAQEKIEPARAALKELLDRERRPLFLKKVEGLKIREDDKEILRGSPDPKNQRQQELLTLHAKELKITNMTDASRRREKELKDLEAAHRPPPLPMVLAITEGKPVPAWLLARGEVDQKTEPVTVGFLSAVGHPEPAPGNGRRALADWLTDPERGAGRLLARVAVNRLWLHHFGEGLVRTPNDFGAQGEPPTHPELLDRLAAELLAQRWSFKALHRMILTSAAYRQAAGPSHGDPENRLWGRRRPRRQEAEVLRDSLLAVSGRLDLAMYGPGVKVPIPAELIITRTEGEHHYPKNVEDGPAVWRRSVYTFLKRSVAAPWAELFDAPSTSTSCGRRIPTTVAPQALLLLNDPFVRARAKDFAARVEKDDDPIGRAYALALGRGPSATEREAAAAYLGSRRLEDFCHTLFTLNEFVYVD